MAQTIDLSGNLTGLAQRIIGTQLADFLGTAVAGGQDVNGDGVPDLVVTARGYDASGDNRGGAFVILGGENAFGGGDINVGSIGAAMSIFGPADGQNVGRSVGLVDVNNDGFADILIGDNNDDTTAGNAGAVYVVFGSASPVNVDLATLTTNQGFRFLGEGLGDMLGFGRNIGAPGDVNNDGIPDIFLGSNFNGDTGAGYVIFGGAGFGSGADVPLFGNADQKIVGPNTGGVLGFPAVGAGDVNGDGIDDLLIGDTGADGGLDRGGIAYLIFGSESSSATIDPSGLGDGGFAITATVTADFLGDALAIVPDANGDGIDDILVGISNSDQAFLIFGSAGLGADIALASFAAGQGVAFSGEGIGAHVSSAGDFNGDGIADLLISADSDDTNGSNAGAAYVVFGGTNLPSTLDLENMSDAQGVKILGALAGDDLSESGVAAIGDVNQDGFDDILIGADGAQVNSVLNVGASYIVFGFATAVTNQTLTGDADANDLRGAGGDDTLSGGGGDDTLAAAGGNDSLDGGDGNDRAYGQAGDDTVGGDAGDDFVAGNLGNDSLTGGDGDDTAKGHVGDDTLFGALGLDLLFGGGDDDMLSGGDGDDVLNGNSGQDTIEGGAGVDILRGQAGSDVIRGGAGNDAVRGMQGNDILFGGDGDDDITGGPANDTMTGGAGNDAFIFGRNHGDNLIEDFTPGGGDSVVLIGTGLGFGDLTIVDTANGARITFEDNPTTAITLSGAFAADLTAGDFTFFG